MKSSPYHTFSTLFVSWSFHPSDFFFLYIFHTHPFVRAFVYTKGSVCGKREISAPFNFHIRDQSFARSASIQIPSFDSFLPVGWSFDPNWVGDASFRHVGITRFIPTHILYIFCRISMVFHNSLWNLIALNYNESENSLLITFLLVLIPMYYYFDQG